MKPTIALVLFGFVLVTLTFISPAGASVPGFTGLGILPDGSYSLAYGISADGSTVVGYGNSASDDEAFRWTAGGGMVGLGDLPGGRIYSRAYGVSADGSTVVGRSFGDWGYEAFRWTADGGMVGLGDLPGGNPWSHAFGVSADGSTVVGVSSSASGTEAFRWTSGGGMVGLGDLPGGYYEGIPHAVSADGAVVVGMSATGSGREAFRWTAESGMVGLGDLPGGDFFSKAIAVSDDGTVVTGVSDSASGTQVFRWTSGEGMVGLGVLPDWQYYYGASYASVDASADGSVVVGKSISASGWEAFIWDAANGMQNLKVVLEDKGLDLTGWRLKQAYDISDDGLTIVGYGRNPSGYNEAWIANLPRPILDAVIDIKPGGDVNPINLKSKGVLSVAIFGDEDLDVSEILLGTLKLAGAGPAERGNSGKIGVFKDINGDSILDLLLYFDMEDMIIDEDATELTLLGMLNDGMELAGSDSIRIVPSNGKGSLGDLGLLEQPYIPEPATVFMLCGAAAPILLKRRRFDAVHRRRSV